MTPEDVEKVQNSFNEVKPVLRLMGGLFYANLFMIAPHVRPLFKANVDEQGRKLMETLGTVVSLLRHPEKMGPAIISLGDRHATYTVREEYFEPVGQALIATLKQTLDEKFTPDVELAWINVYMAASQLMQQGLSQGRQRLANQHKGQLVEIQAPQAAPAIRVVCWKRLLRLLHLSQADR